MSSPLAQFDSIVASSDVTFIIYYRGHWCKFCQSYLRTLQSLTPSLTSSSGTVLAITAEPTSALLSKTRELTGYTGPVIIDTQHEIAKGLKTRAVVDVAITEKKGYEFGLAQPAVVVLKRDGSVLESWAIVPSLMNFGGASDRPELEQVWENAKAKLEGGKKVHLAYKKLGMMGMIMGKV